MSIFNETEVGTAATVGELKVLLETQPDDLPLMNLELGKITLTVLEHDRLIPDEGDEPTRTEQIKILYFE